MTEKPWEGLNLDELRSYILANREDTAAFYAYIDRSKQNGRMITVDLAEANWENTIDSQIKQAQSQ
jgi:hypothetical protein